VSEVIYTTAMK